MRIHPAFAASLIAALSLQELVGAQTPSGRKIQAKNGDVILVENADRVGLIRRKEAQVRAIHNPLQRWLVLLVDYAPPGVDPDGQVDASYRYLDVAGEWPLGERWEGRAVIDDYSMAGEGGPYGIGFSSSLGLIQVLGLPAVHLSRTRLPSQRCRSGDPAAPAARRHSTSPNNRKSRR